MVANPEEKNRWRLLPTAAEWAEFSRFTRALLAIDDPGTRRRRLEHLSLAKPRLARRLALVIGLTLVP